MKPPLAVVSVVFVVVVVAVLAYGLAAPQSTMLGPAVTRGSGDRRELALTFDDGPSPYTAAVLDVLRKKHVRATFFLCGRNVERYPEIARRIRDEGHTIGNHTYSHSYLYLDRDSEISSEIDRAQDSIERVTGKRPTIFRPPFGVRWFSLSRLLAERGLTMVMWTVREDIQGRDAAAISRETLARLSPGGILLLHDAVETRPAAEFDRSVVAAALPAIIDGARKAGYRFVALAKEEGPIARR